MSEFNRLGLAEPLLRALEDAGYSKPTPIQAQAIPPLLEGRDVLGCAQTGTGKTAAFSLPVLQRMAANPGRGRRVIRALVLTPTRELAAQIGESFSDYGRHLRSRHLVIFGGVKENPQIAALRKGLDILVATPGRLLDLHGRDFIDLSRVEFFVLDEADRMLDMGFVNDVRKVLEVLPRKRQNLLFSATMPPAIVRLAGSFLRDPVQIEVTPQATTVERIRQSVMFVERANKKNLLADLLGAEEDPRAIVFTRTKHGANRLVKKLDKRKIASAAIHGNKSQAARTRALEAFRTGDIGVLIATDIASRGIDIDDVTHVVNYDLPNEPESYVHRIGRTGRAGREGVAISFCDETEGEYLREIEHTIGMEVPVVTEHEYHFEAAIPPPGRPGKKPKRPRGSSRGGASRRGRPARPGARPKRSGSPEDTPGKRVGTSAGKRPGATKAGKRPTSNSQPSKRAGAPKDGPGRPKRRRRRVKKSAQG